MLRLVAKGLQFLGFLFATSALLVMLLEEHALARELQLLFVGAACFYAGRYLDPDAT